MTQLVEAIVYKPMREVALDAARTSQCKRLHMTQLVEATVYKSMQEVALDAACRNQCTSQF